MAERRDWRDDPLRATPHQCMAVLKQGNVAGGVHPVDGDPAECARGEITFSERWECDESAVITDGAHFLTHTTVLLLYLKVVGGEGRGEQWWLWWRVRRHTYDVASSVARERS